MRLSVSGTRFARLLCFVDTCGLRWVYTYYLQNALFSPSNEVGVIYRIDVKNVLISLVNKRDQYVFYVLIAVLGSVCQKNFLVVCHTNVVHHPTYFAMLRQNVGRHKGRGHFASGTSDW